MNNIWIALTNMGEPRLIVKVDSQETNDLANKLLILAGFDTFNREKDDIVYVSVNESGISSLGWSIYNEVQFVKRFDTKTIIDVYDESYDEFMDYSEFRVYIHELRGLLDGNPVSNIILRLRQSMLNMKNRLSRVVSDNYINIGVDKF